jgi:hypothetical protein
VHIPIAAYPPYPPYPPYICMTHVSSSSNDTCILLLIYAPYPPYPPYPPYICIRAGTSLHTYIHACIHTGRAQAPPWTSRRASIGASTWKCCWVRNLKRSQKKFSKKKSKKKRTWKCCWDFREKISRASIQNQPKPDGFTAQDLTKKATVCILALLHNS